MGYSFRLQQRASVNLRVVFRWLPPPFPHRNVLRLRPSVTQTKTHRASMGTKRRTFQLANHFFSFGSFFRNFIPSPSNRKGGGKGIGMPRAAFSISSTYVLQNHHLVMRYVFWMFATVVLNKDKQKDTQNKSQFIFPLPFSFRYLGLFFGGYFPPFPPRSPFPFPILQTQSTVAKTTKSFQNAEYTFYFPL